MSQPSLPTSYLERYLEPFQDLLLRDDIVEIAINPDGKVRIEAAGDATMRYEGQTVDRATAFNMAQSIVGDTNARASEKNPPGSGKVEYAGRPLHVQVAAPPAIEQGAPVKIRLFATAGVKGYKPSYLFGKSLAGSHRRSNALLQASLRMRPDRIIVGELRGDGALTYLEAINTGNGGSVSTTLRTLLSWQ